MSDFAQEIYANLFEYNPENGSLLWRNNGCRHSKGGIVGNKAHRKDTSYLVITINYKKHYVHRVIWELHHGLIKKGMCIDHIDSNGLNNKMNNLRLVTLSQNQRNRRISKQHNSGYMGIAQRNSKHGYVVNIANKYIGTFSTLKEAISERDKIYMSNGFHKNHGMERTA